MSKFGWFWSNLYSKSVCVLLGLEKYNTLCQLPLESLIGIESINGRRVAGMSPHVTSDQLICFLSHCFCWCISGLYGTVSPNVSLFVIRWWKQFIVSWLEPEVPQSDRVYKTVSWWILWKFLSQSHISILSFLWQYLTRIHLNINIFRRMKFRIIM